MFQRIEGKYKWLTRMISIVPDTTRLVYRKFQAALSIPTAFNLGRG